MGSAFVVLGTFYRPAIGEFAAIAKAAVHIKFATIGVAIPLYHRAGVAALQPEVGPRGRRRGEAGRESERGSRNGQFHVLSLPLAKDVKPAKRLSHIQPLGENRRFALLEGRIRAVRRLPDHPRGTLRTPAAVPGFYGRARRLALTHPVRCQKTISGSTLLTPRFPD
jgi:hypothetical protein